MRLPPDKFDPELCIASRVGLSAGLFGGLPLRLGFPLLYRSAVAGRGKSGRLGRRIGADIRPCPLVVFDEVRVGLVTGAASEAGGARVCDWVTVPGAERFVVWGGC